MKLIFQLGTNNWQTADEPAPGSGILHESRHKILNQMAGVKCFSMYPSPRAVAISDDYRIFRIPHDIPICESAAPASSYRWHSMTEEQFSAYRNRLTQEVYDFMEEIEAKEKQSFTFAIAHHSFLNPLVMRDVIARRVEHGKPRTPLCCFLHGTGLKMFLHEMADKNPEEYPMRFHKMMVGEKVFDDLKKGVSICMSASPALFDQMKVIFPTFPQERIFSSTPGVNSDVFYPQQLKVAEVLKSLGKSVWPGQSIEYDKVIVFAGKLADWKRIDALLLAAKKYGPKLDRTVTLIVGGGLSNELRKLTDLAEKAEIEHVYFVGPRSQEVLAQLFNIGSVGVFPSFEEPFLGTVFIECGLRLSGHWCEIRRTGLLYYERSGRVSSKTRNE